MKKLLPALVLSLLFFAFFGGQLTKVANAQVVPLTSPAPFFTISGQVTTKLVGNWAKNLQRIKLVANATVTFKNFFTGVTVGTTTTDASGMYSFNPPGAGLYAVTVSGVKADFLVPPFRYIHDQKVGGKNHQDFQGYILPKFNGFNF